MSSFSPDPRLHTAYEDGVAEIVMAFPPVNAFDGGFLDAVHAAVRAVPEEAGALVVASAVDRVFAAGGDIPFMAHAPIEAQLDYVRRCQETYSAFEELACPVVVAIDGACMGGGVELALACDLRVVGASAKLGLPEVKLGILPGAGGTQRLGRVVGGGVARDLLLTGRSFTGQEAATMGLASRLVADGEALPAARALARELAGGATPAIRAVKRLAVAAPDLALADGLAREREAWEAARRSGHAQEALEAFADKRRPDFARVTS